MDFLTSYAEAVKTAAGFFWKAGWAFVLGYAISAMIQAFVPKTRLTRHMGAPDAKSVSLSTLFGMISSSCSFAALAAARSLVRKGAHFVSAVAFMFASTNLVIELGILIFIFLGWQFLVAEIIGGLILIAISSTLIRLTYPKRWMEAAREKVEAESEAETERFDPMERIKSLKGWARVGNQFVEEWLMVWQEILIGFTIAGFIAVFVPNGFWQALFLTEFAAANPANFWVVLQNAMIAPFVAAATFIGSMGNIPLATVLSSGGVLFAGIMGFIYSDLMVPPLVKVNAKYYGWRIALYIAAIMYVSIVITAIALHYGFYWLDAMPETGRAIEEAARFKLDYTVFMNVAALAVIAIMLWLRRKHHQLLTEDGGGHDHDHGGGGLGVQDIVTGVFILALLGGGVVFFITGGG